MLRIDAVMRAAEPRLEVAEHAMDAGEDHHGLLGAALGFRAVPVA